MLCSRQQNFLGHKFWARGYFVSTDQEMADKQLDQLH
jgi:hypothetical protein